MSRKSDKKAAEAAPSEDLRPRLSQHPRAKRQIREAKGWGGMAGFVLVGLLSMQASLPIFDAGIRALVAGVACYVIAWGVAVTVWRHLAQAEISVVEQRLQSEQTTS